MFAKVMMVICFSISIICFIIAVRNYYIYEYRKQLLEKVAAKAKAYLNAHPTCKEEEWMKYFDWYRKISIEKMLFMFWKPLKSFYDESELERI